MSLSNKDTAVNFQCIDAIKASLCIEKEGLGFYERAGKQVRDPKIKEMFARLAEEEKEHIQSLQEKARNLQPALSRKSESQSADRFIEEKLRGQVFPVSKGKTFEFPDIQNDVEALEFGIESEKRSIEVLTNLLKTESKIDVRAIFMHLVVEEKKHLQALEELKASLARSGK